MSTPQKIISSVGLILDIVGALLIWKYGLPESINRKGMGFLVLESVDDEQILKAKRYDRLSKIGLSLLILGFSLQLLSNLV